MAQQRAEQPLKWILIVGRSNAFECLLRVGAWVAGAMGATKPYAPIEAWYTLHGLYAWWWGGTDEDRAASWD